MSHKPAGGIKSGVNNRSAGYRAGGRVREVRPGGADQLGRKVGSHTMYGGDTNYRGEKLYGDKSFQPCVMGNKQTMGTNGPGKGMNLYGKSGSQNQYGAANPGNAPAKNRDILSGFGPESPNVARKR